MDLKKQIINNTVDEVMRQWELDRDTAFLRYTHSLMTGKGPASFDEEDQVDGGQDKQIDALTIEESDGSADVFITQATIGDSFSSNKLIQLKNGLDWIFQKSRKDLNKLPNQSLRDKIIQLRAVQTEVGPSNLRIEVNFIANSDSSKASDEFMTEKGTIEQEYDNNTFENFSINVVGTSEILDKARARDRNTRSVNAALKIRWSQNTASLIEYHSQGLKGLVCTIPAHEIARLVNDNPDGSIFDLNIRQYLGSRGTVNREIYGTSSGDDSYEFWFLNNGITIVCDKFDTVKDPDSPLLKLTNLQIVNGCQTATTLANVQKQKALKKDTYVIVRVYETADADLVGKIVLTTNNQNQITSRNLRANDTMQIDMEKAFQIHGYYYERKPRQFDGVRNIDVKKLFTNEEVGQAYLAIVLKNPSDARTRRYKIWGELNNKVFSGGPVQPYIFSAVVIKNLSRWLRQSPFHKSDNTTERTIAKRGLYHIGRVSAFLLADGDKWQYSEQIEVLIKDIENGSKDLEKVFSKAFGIVKQIVLASEYKDDVERGLKASIIDRSIEVFLYNDTHRQQMKIPKL